MDEEPTQNFFRPQDDRTQVLGPPPPGPAFPGPPPAAPPSVPGTPPGWPQPIWRRRGALIGAGLLVLVIAGLVVGIVLAAPGTPPTPANAAVASPITSGPPVAGKAHHAPKLAPGEKVVSGTVSSVTNGQITVTPAKGGNPVTVTADATTKFAGTATSVTDLHPGERVQMIVRNGTAVTVRAREAATTG